jgi:hypothetical protein
LRSGFTEFQRQAQQALARQADVKGRGSDPVNLACRLSDKPFARIESGFDRLPHAAFLLILVLCHGVDQGRFPRFVW